MNMNLGQFNIVLFVAIGYVIGNIAEPIWKWSSATVLALGAFLMIAPRVPRWLRQAGIGLILASNLMQGWMENLGVMLADSFAPSTDQLAEG